MAIAIRVTDFPDGPGTDMYDRVVAEMNLANDPPEGLIFHWAGDVDGKWTITDVWESYEAHEKFGADRLGPAIRAVYGADSTDAPRPTVSEFAVHNFTRGVE
jgi:hypothetical protein